MFLISKCPYCNRVYRREYGIQKFYNYESERNVWIDEHAKCGRFIHRPIKDVSWVRYDIPEEFKKSYLYHIEECVLEELNEQQLPSEQDILSAIVKYLHSEKGGNHSDAEIETNLQNIKIIMEAIVGQVNMSAIFSKPLTKEVEDKLVYQTMICYD